MNETSADPNGSTARRNFGKRSPPLANAWWNRMGPTWYISTWWPGEKLAAKQYSLLTVLSIAQSERIEPKVLIKSLALEHRGAYRRRLKQLANRMTGAATVADALEQTPDALSDRAVLAIRFGAQSGTACQVYQQLLETERPGSEISSQELRGVWRYCAALGLILAFMTMFIVPTLKKMFSEFEMKLPEAFVLLLHLMDFIVANIELIILAAIVAACLYWSSLSRRFFRRNIAPRLSSPLNDANSSDLLQLLSVASESGRPLAGSLSTLARYHYNKPIRQRLLFARNEIEQGANAWTSLSDSRLIQKSEAQVLAATDSCISRTWLLREIARSKSERLHRRHSLLSVFAHPIVILIFAVGVLWICFAFFNVLTQLILDLAAAGEYSR